MDVSVKYIMCIPKNKNKWKYYVNENFNDSHILNREKLQYFINTKLTGKESSQVISFMNSFTPFFIDFERSIVIELKFDLQKNLEIIRDQMISSHLNPKKALKVEKNREKSKTIEEMNQSMIRSQLTTDN